MKNVKSYSPLKNGTQCPPKIASSIFFFFFHIINWLPLLRKCQMNAYFCSEPTEKRSPTLYKTQTQNDESIHFCCFNNLTTIRIDESHLITDQNERMREIHTEASTKWRSSISMLSYQYESSAHSSLACCEWGAHCVGDCEVVRWPLESNGPDGATVCIDGIFIRSVLCQN